MVRKITVVGNSYAITLPRDYLSALGLEAGAKVKVELDPLRRAIIIRPEGMTPTFIDPEFAARVERFLREHRDILEALAR
ncbi:MAG: AbrB/MazE/SpoVT family DNA-binding domain-containing protein [Candidatus Methylomirabilales bacterium]